LHASKLLLGVLFEGRMREGVVQEFGPVIRCEVEGAAVTSTGKVVVKATAVSGVAVTFNMSVNMPIGRDGVYVPSRVSRISPRDAMAGRKTSRTTNCAM